MEAPVRHRTEVHLTEGDPRRVIVSFALPVLLSQLFQQLYSTADTWIVGHFRGTEALAAVSSSGSLTFLMISFFVGTSMGAGVVISRYFGARESEKTSRAVHTTVLLSLIMGAFLTAFGVAATPVLLRWMGTDPDVLPQSIIYFRYIFLGSIPMVMYNSLRGIMSAVGDSRRPLYYLILSSVLNILLDALFVGVFRWGVWAAAVATALSQAVSAVLCLIQLMKKGNVYTLSADRMRIDGPLVREILRYGLPSGVQNSVIAIANVLVQTNINSFGKLAMAACGAYSKIEGFAFLPITSFSMALTTFIGQNLGAKEYDRARRGARFGLTMGVAMAELIGVAVFALAPLMIRTFDQNPEVVAIGTMQARIEAPFYCLLALSHCVSGVCRGCGRASVPMYVMLSIWCVFRIIYITAAMHVRHVIWLLFCAYPLTWFISSVIFMIYYLKSDWVHGFEKKTGGAERSE